MIDFDFIDNDSEQTVLFLHGWGGDKNSFAIVKNCITYESNMVFISFSGFGKSPPPRSAYSVDDYVNEVKELLDYLKIEKGLSIVCHSFGARVAVKLITKYPNLVSKLIIVDGAGIKPKRGLKYFLKVKKYKRLKRLVHAGKKDKSILDRQGSKDYQALPENMKQTFVNVVNEDLSSYFKNIKCPTILFWGTKDKDTPMYMARKIKKSIKNSSLITVDAGHFSYLEASEVFLSVLNNFLF